MALFDDSRSDWNASKATWNHSVSPSRRVRRVWHYPGGATGISIKDPHGDCLALVKTWQNYHKSKGWGDIGYNFLICVHARAIEGRGRDWVGAHCPGWNTEGWGIQFMTGVGETTSTAMFNRGIQLAQDLERAAGHDLYDNGHRENYPTACPGDQIQKWVNAGGPESVTNVPKPDLIPGLNVAKLQIDGYLGPRTIKVGQMIQKARGHKIVVDGKIDPDDSLFVRSIQMDLNEKGFKCDHRRKLVVDGQGIQPNLTSRWPESGYTHTLEACFNARPKVGGTGWIASPAVLVKMWQKDMNNGARDNFLWFK